MKHFRRIKSSPKVWYVPSDAHQPGSLVELNKEYAKTDPSKYHFSVWLDLRKKWFKDLIKATGSNLFTCALCARDGLDPWSKIKRNLATIDHIIPVKKAPWLWNDPSNFQVACNHCNQKKGCN